MKESKLTDFGLAVKTELLKRGKPQSWLEQEVREKTGLYVDHSYMYRILTGQRAPESIMDAICSVLSLEEGGD